MTIRTPETDYIQAGRFVTVRVAYERDQRYTFSTAARAKAWITQQVESEEDQRAANAAWVEWATR